MGVTVEGSEAGRYWKSWKAQIKHEYFMHKLMNVVFHSNKCIQ